MKSAFSRLGNTTAIVLYLAVLLGLLADGYYAAFLVTLAVGAYIFIGAALLGYYLSNDKNPEPGINMLLVLAWPWVVRRLRRRRQGDVK